jgi:hypothetical protein
MLSVSAESKLKAAKESKKLTEESIKEYEGIIKTRFGA